MAVIRGEPMAPGCTMKGDAFVVLANLESCHSCGCYFDHVAKKQTVFQE